MTEELAPQTIYSIQQWDIWKAVSNNDIGQLGTVMDNNMKYYISHVSMPIQNMYRCQSKIMFYKNVRCWDFMQMKKYELKKFVKMIQNFLFNEEIKYTFFFKASCFDENI